MAGGSLFDMLHPKNQVPGAAALVRLPLSRVLRFCTGIASGMVYLHSHGVMHRDLKSGNLLLDAAREHIKVGDFGVARRMDTSADDSMTSETGTYRWMAPEVIRHGKYDSSVDVYSFGIVLWEMLTGQMPYGHLSPVQAASAVVHNNLRPPIIAQMPANLVALMCVCWNHEARVRPSFDVLLVETQRLLDLETQRPGGAAQAAPPAWAEAFAPLPRAADTDAGESTPQVATPDAADRKAHTWSVEDLTHRLTTAGPTEGAVSQRLGREAGTEEVKVPPGPRRMSSGGTQMRQLSAVVKDDDVVQLQVVSGAAIPCPPEGGGSAAPSDYARGMQPATQRLRRGFLSSMGITCCESQALSL
jgi:serine/threonine protein kinase